MQRCPKGFGDTHLRFHLLGQTSIFVRQGASVRRRSRWRGSNGASGALNVDGSSTTNSERCSTILPAPNLFLTRVHIQCVCHSVHRLLHQSKWHPYINPESDQTHHEDFVCKGMHLHLAGIKKKCKIHIDQMSDVNGIVPRNVQLVIIGHSPHPHAKSHRSSLTHAAPPTAATSSLHPC